MTTLPLLERSDRDDNECARCKVIDVRCRRPRRRDMPSRISAATPPGSTQRGTWPQPFGSSHRVCAGNWSRTRDHRGSSQSHVPNATVTGTSMATPPVNGTRVASKVSKNAVDLRRSSIAFAASEAGILRLPTDIGSASISSRSRPARMASFSTAGHVFEPDQSALNT